MKTLLMDTSNTYLIVAIYDNDTCLAKIQEHGNKRQSEYALLHAHSLLQKQQLTMQDMDEMVITIGPGSYTGVRVALTIAKTLAAVTKIKIKAISSLKAYVGTGDGISVLDARSQKVYVGCYQQGKEIVPEQLLPIVDFEKFCIQYPTYVVYGDSELVGKQKQEVDLVDHLYQLSKTQEYVENVDALVPHYIKDVEAKKIC